MSVTFLRILFFTLLQYRWLLRFLKYHFFTFLQYRVTIFIIVVIIIIVVVIIINVITTIIIIIVTIVIIIIIITIIIFINISIVNIITIIIIMYPAPIPYLVQLNPVSERNSDGNIYYSTHCLVSNLEEALTIVIRIIRLNGSNLGCPAEVSQGD